MDSTTDFGSVGLGSNPCRGANIFWVGIIELYLPDY